MTCFGIQCAPYDVLIRTCHCHMATHEWYKSGTSLEGAGRHEIQTSREVHIRLIHEEGYTIRVTADKN